MAYAPAGSTSGANPPILALQPIAVGTNSTHGSTVAASLIGGKLHIYISSHTQAGAAAAGFVTDAEKLGWVANDMVIVNQISGPVSFHRVTSVSSTGATLSAGLMVSSAS